MKVGDKVRLNNHGLDTLMMNGYSDLSYKIHTTSHLVAAGKRLKSYSYIVDRLDQSIRFQGANVYRVYLEEGSPLAAIITDYEVDTDCFDVIEEESTMTKIDESKGKLPWTDTAEASFIKADTLKKLPVLLDGDIVAYRVAAAADGRHYTINGVYEQFKHKGESVKTKFRYKKEAVKYADQHSIPNSEIELAFDPEKFDKVVSSIDSMITSMEVDYKERGYAPEIRIFLTGATNFRTALYPEYKASRVNVRRPYHLAAAKQYMLNNKNAILHEGLEADDLIGMSVHKILSRGGVGDTDALSVSVATIDKDFIQLLGAGVEMYDFTNSNVTVVSKREALLYFYKQGLIGDKTDDIPGIPGVGPQTALKYLKGLKTEKSMCKAVLSAYQEKLDLSDEETIKVVLRTLRLLYLTREMGKLYEFPAGVF